MTTSYEISNAKLVNILGHFGYKRADVDFRDETLVVLYDGTCVTLDWNDEQIFAEYHGCNTTYSNDWFITKK